MCRLLACAVIALCLVTPASAQLENVGNLSFPTSAKPEAQRHFLRGVAILHSFGWKQAIAEFQLAQKAQPDFAMAYWGESLSYNHPLNSQMDYKDPRAVLARLGPDRASRVAKAPTDREKGFMNAVEDLWGEGDSRQRRIAYMNAMERLYKQFPNDDEVKTFYALSILSGASAVDDRTSRMNVKAGSLAMEVFKRNPSHPGAVHYIIHAFDDPVHAPLALEAAHTYAKIVPAVSHAVHMPTHIFIQHGMWNEVANQNIRAFNVAKELWQPGDVPGDMSHSGDWGQYRLPAARRLRRRARAHLGLRVDGRDHQEPARQRRVVAGACALHHRDRRVEGAAGGGERVERDDPRQWLQRREDRRHGHRGEDGSAAGHEGQGRSWRCRGAREPARRTRCRARTRTAAARQAADRMPAKAFASCTRNCRR